MREHHPDTLASRNVPPRFVEHATRRVAEINAAWNRIKRERGPVSGAQAVRGGEGDPDHRQRRRRTTTRARRAR
ncbi:MAG: hypothetical protein RML45_15270 [Acetobacteraceae bacterium]|nr:hypothetical protein [Acetobacteraceae bacterium]